VHSPGLPTVFEKWAREVGEGMTDKNEKAPTEAQGVYVVARCLSLTFGSRNCVSLCRLPQAPRRGTSLLGLCLIVSSFCDAAQPHRVRMRIDLGPMLRPCGSDHALGQVMRPEGQKCRTGGAGFGPPKRWEGQEVYGNDRRVELSET